MRDITDFSPEMQLTLRYLGGASLGQLAKELGVSKQAVHKKVQKVLHQIRKAASYNFTFPSEKELEQSRKEIERLKQVANQLQQKLIIASAQKQMLQFFKDRVLKSFPHFKKGRLSGWQKKRF